MLDRNDRERAEKLRSRQSGVWRYARQTLSLAVVMVMVWGSWLVKVGAVAGNLDLTFSNDGKQITGFGSSDTAEAVAIQANGRIVVAGHTREGPAKNFAVARYNSNGTLDASFSTDGKQITDLGGADFALAVAIQGDGKILVAGFTDLGGAGTDFALARYNTNGTLDNTFSGDGLVTTDFNGGSDIAYAMLIQPNGRIVVGGSASSGGAGDDFALARYNTNGTLDTSFSGDGKQTTDFGTLGEVATAIAIQSNGRIVAAGVSAVDDTDYNFALARYTTAGALDTSFSGDGKTTTDFGNNSLAHGVALQSNGRIVAAGNVLVGAAGAKFALARYNGNGSLDDGSLSDSTPGDEFGTDGLVTTDFLNGFDAARDVAIQSDDKIVAAGHAANAGNSTHDFALARYEADGALDNSFNGDGKLTTSFFAGPEEAHAVAIQADGKIVVAGYAYLNNSLRNEFALARYYGN